MSNMAPDTDQGKTDGCLSERRSMRQSAKDLPVVGEQGLGRASTTTGLTTGGRAEGQNACNGRVAEKQRMKNQSSEVRKDGYLAARALLAS